MPQRLRNSIITIFVICWTILFHYESTRYFYLNPFFKRDLPKMKFLFPPAGWIMFFNVDESYGFAEVYGVKDGQAQLIDPHEILRTRAIGYDNIYRNVLSTVLSPHFQGPFCRFLERKFPDFDGFVVTAVEYPSVIKERHRRLQQVVYQCKLKD